jgi:hypothetical protein
VHFAFGNSKKLRIHPSQQHDLRPQFTFMMLSRQGWMRHCAMHVSKDIYPCLPACPHKILRGLIPADDAPDIVANTFLAQLSDEKLTAIRYGFLDHRESR